MDVSPVQSGSKCASSDFSIERLLSDDTKSREEGDQVPDWLCCTRYRPPRLPRAPAGCRARRAGRHARVPFTAAQAGALEAAYARAPYLAPPALRALAAALQLRDDRIKIWFQNRRARERREKSVNIAPPNGITLPPTPRVPPNTTNSWIPHTTQATIKDRSHRVDADILTNMQKYAIIRGTHMQRLETNARLSNMFKESHDDDDVPLDIETVED